MRLRLLLLFIFLLDSALAIRGRCSDNQIVKALKLREALEVIFEKKDYYGPRELLVDLYEDDETRWTFTITDLKVEKKKPIATTTIESIEEVKERSDPLKENLDHYIDIALDTERPMMERAQAIADEHNKPMKGTYLEKIAPLNSVGLLLGMSLAGAADQKALEYAERFGENWKSAAREFIKGLHAFTKLPEEQKKAEIEKLEARLEKKYGKIKNPQVTTTKTPFIATTTIGVEEEMKRKSSKSYLQKLDRYIEIAIDTDRPALERAQAIADEHNKPIKGSPLEKIPPFSMLGMMLGMSLSTLADTKEIEFRSRFGDNWKPATREFIKEIQTMSSKLSEEEKKKANEEIDARLERKYGKMKLPETTSRLMIRPVEKKQMFMMPGNNNVMIHGPQFGAGAPFGMLG